MLVLLYIQVAYSARCMRNERDSDLWYTGTAVDGTIGIIRAQRRT